MKIAAYVRVSTDDQNEDRRMRAIRSIEHQTFRRWCRAGAPFPIRRV